MRRAWRKISGMTLTPSPSNVRPQEETMVKDELQEMLTVFSDGNGFGDPEVPVIFAPRRSRPREWPYPRFRGFLAGPAVDRARSSRAAESRRPARHATRLWP
jgi:hypothetical protein